MAAEDFVLIRDYKKIRKIQLENSIKYKKPQQTYLNSWKPQLNYLNR